MRSLLRHCFVAPDPLEPSSIGEKDCPSLRGVIVHDGPGSPSWRRAQDIGFPAVARSDLTARVVGGVYLFGKLQKISETFRQAFRTVPKSVNFFRIPAENLTG